MELAPLKGDGVVLGAAGAAVANGQRGSDNFSWHAAHDAGYRGLTRLPEARVTATTARLGDEEIRVHLRNTGPVAALAGKLTLLHTDGTQVLPYYSDDYLSLLAGWGACGDDLAARGRAKQRNSTGAARMECEADINRSTGLMGFNDMRAK